MTIIKLIRCTLPLSLFLLCACSSPIIQKHQLASDTTRLRQHVNTIIKTPAYRNYKNTTSLNMVASYISQHFKTVSDSVTEQHYTFRDSIYKNIICSINPDKKERIIIGAHYDVCGDQDGADDNASGVAGLLELATLMKNIRSNYRFDFVAYTLEEPPFFGSELMGSYIHAKSLFEKNVPVKGMICLEMIGYFNDAPGSQEYPLGFLKWFYGDKADYITVVKKYWNGSFCNEMTSLMQDINLLPTKSFSGPESLTGVDFSDHRNYWKFDYSAVMITNTAFYRNKNYHEKSDRIETLDFKRMALTIDELFMALQKLE